jgi:broad specificity phosphatase PhoE
MVKIYIARHGQNEDNANGILTGHRDMPLTSIGQKQAYDLAENIKEAEITFDAVYTSPLVRASKTAEIVCETLGLSKPIVLDALIERNFGTMTGKLVADIEKLCAPDIVKTENTIYFLSPSGAETFPELLNRARHVLDCIHKEHPSGSVLLVTHGDFGKMIYASYYNLPWRDMLTSFYFGNGDLLLLAEGVNPSEPHVLKMKQYNE